MFRKLAVIIFILLIIPNLIYSKAENNSSLDSIKQEFLKLRQWEKELQEKETRLKKLELDIIEKEEKLKEIKNEISEIYNKVKEMREENIKDLSTIYSKMKPEQAAEVINKMDVNLAVKIFLKMKPNKTAKILNIINKDKAVKITEKLALYGIKINIGGR